MYFLSLMSCMLTGTRVSKGVVGRFIGSVIGLRATGEQLLCLLGSRNFCYFYSLCMLMGQNWLGVDILVIFFNSMAKTLVNYSEFWYIPVSDFSLLVLQAH